VRLTLEEVLKATGGHLASPGPSSLTISGVSTDTRTLRPGDLFVPLRGPRTDGHNFIRDAFANGAAASLVTHAVQGLPSGGVTIHVRDLLQALAGLAAHYRSTLGVRVVGVTGSVGKTTTTAMCAAVLATQYRVARTKDEWNAEIGVPLTLLGLDRAHQVAIVEMAMRGLGQISELVAIARPEIGVLTNIAESHLELLGSIDNVARAKGELIEGLPASGTAVLNADDPRVIALAARSKARVVTYGIDAAADVRGTSVEFTTSGMRFTITSPDARISATLPVFGLHNVRNALAAASVGMAMGVKMDALRDALAHHHPPKMRLQPVEASGILIINDAYNASPTSMQAAFEVLSEVSRGRRRVAVLGEMKELGPSSGMMHFDVGAAVADFADILVTVGGGDAVEIANGAAGAMASERVHTVPSTFRAIDLLRELLRPGDVVLVKGSRAMEMERVVAGIVEAMRPGPEAHQG